MFTHVMLVIVVGLSLGIIGLLVKVLNEMPRKQRHPSQIEVGEFRKMATKFEDGQIIVVSRGGEIHGTNVSITYPFNNDITLDVFYDKEKGQGGREYVSEMNEAFLFKMANDQVAIITPRGVLLVLIPRDVAKVIPVEAS